MKIIKIGALWCPGCLIVNSSIKKIKEEYNLEIIEYDYDFNSEEVLKYNVGDILPVIIIESNGKEVNRLIGERTYTEIKEAIEEIGEI
jgi:thiol-disulfide isomerase/thioredoxin